MAQASLHRNRDPVSNFHLYWALIWTNCLCRPDQGLKYLWRRWVERNQGRERSLWQETCQPVALNVNIAAAAAAALPISVLDALRVPTSLRHGLGKKMFAALWQLMRINAETRCTESRIFRCYFFFFISIILEEKQTRQNNLRRIKNLWLYTASSHIYLCSSSVFIFISAERFVLVFVAVQKSVL